MVDMQMSHTVAAAGLQRCGSVLRMCSTGTVHAFKNVPIEFSGVFKEAPGAKLHASSGHMASSTHMVLLLRQRVDDVAQSQQSAVDADALRLAAALRACRSQE